MHSGHYNHYIASLIDLIQCINLITTNKPTDWHCHVKSCYHYINFNTFHRTTVTGALKQQYKQIAIFSLFKEIQGKKNNGFISITFKINQCRKLCPLLYSFDSAFIWLGSLNWVFELPKEFLRFTNSTKASESDKDGKFIWGVWVFDLKLLFYFI